MKNFSVVKRFQEGTQLFTKPGSEPGTRTTVGPIPWPVLILRDKDESVEYLPSAMTPLKKKPTVQVELIVSQKGKVLSRIRRGKIVVPTLSGRLGKHTTVKLVEKLLRRHKISKEKGELTLIADNPGSGKTVSTYYFAAPPVSLCKGRFQWKSFQQLRDYQTSLGLDTFLTKKKVYLQEASFHVGRTSTLFWAEGEINKTTCRVLLDSGASENFVSSSFKETTQLKTRELLRRVRVNMANGETHYVCNETRPFNLEIGVYQTQVKNALVMASPDWDVVLGRPWLQEENPVIDWKNLKVTCRNTGKLLFNLHLQAAQPTISLVTIEEAARALRSKHNVGFVAKLCMAQDSTQLGTAFGAGNDAKLRNLLHKYEDVFKEPTGLPPKRSWDHRIKLESAEQPNLPTFRMSPAELKEVKLQIEDLLNKGWIRPSSSPFGAPILFVRKKDGTLRMCVDYRRLNAITVKDRTPIPRVDELLDVLGKASVFTSLDLYKGYHQCRVVEEDVQKTAFKTHFGSFEFTVLPFGLTNAPATFQRMMNAVLAPWLHNCCVVYLDDVLIFSTTFEEHLQHLQKIWRSKIFRSNSLHVNLSKCHFGQREVEYLGHIVCPGGVAVDPKKVEAVNNWPTPTTIKEIRGFLGLTGYYRRFIHHYADLALPLTELLKKDQVFRWTPKQQASFVALKTALTSAPVLITPDVSENSEFTVFTDASGFGIGAVLLQNKGDGLRPVSYYARKLDKHEKNYPTHEQELLGV